MRDPATILDEVAGLWFGSRAAYRDALLRVGDLLQEFLLAKAVEAAGLSSKAMVCAERCREDAVTEAATRLKAMRNRVYALVATSQAVALLSGGLGVGQLSYSALTAFKHVVARLGALPGSKDFRRGYRRPEDTLEYRLAREVWSVKPGLGYDPRELFGRAVAEGWTTTAVRNALTAAGRASGARVLVREDHLDCPVSPLRLVELAKHASPKDLTEVILKLIHESSDPEAVRQAVARALTPTADFYVPLSWDS